MTTPSFRAAATNTAVASSSISVTIPASTVAGDLLLLSVSGVGGSPVTPSGWTLVETTFTSGSSPYNTLWTYWKIADGSDAGTNVTVSIASGTSAFAAAVTVWQDGTGVVASDEFTASTSDSSIDAPAVAATGVALRTVNVYGVSGTGSTSITPPNTERAETQVVWSGAPSYYASVSVSDDTSDPDAVRTASLSASRSRRQAHTVVITGNEAPNAPTLTAPIGGVSIDKDATQRFSWSFSDPNTAEGDVQSAYELRYKLTSSGTWTVVSGGATEYRDFSPGSFAAGDWEWQVRTTDNGGLTGPWSSSSFFTAASTPAAPSITAPINNGTISADTSTVEWTHPDQDAYQVRTVADDGAGSPDTGTVYEDTGTVVSTSARAQTIDFSTNNRVEHVQVRVRTDGLWSSWSSVKVTVSYTPPTAPTLTLTEDDTVGKVTVDITNPPDSTLLDLDGSGDYASTPDANRLDITGDLDVRVYVRMDDWTPGSREAFISKWEGTSATKSWLFSIEASTGELELWLSDGSTNSVVTSSAATGVTDGEAKWVRVTYRRSDQRVQFFLSDDGVSWSQLGSDQTHTRTSINPGTDGIEIGSSDAGSNALAGAIFYAEVRNGIDGAVVASFDAEDGFVGQYGGTVTTPLPEPFAHDPIGADPAADHIGGGVAPTGAQKVRYEFDIDVPQLPSTASDTMSLIDHGWVDGPLAILYGDGSVRLYWVYSDGSGNTRRTSAGVVSAGRSRIAIEGSVESGHIYVKTYEHDGSGWIETSTYDTAAPTSSLKVSRQPIELFNGGTDERESYLFEFVAYANDTVVARYDADDIVANGEATTTTDLPEPFVHLDGTGDSITTPDSAALDITGDIDVRAHMAMDDWTPAVNSAAVARYIGSGGDDSFIFTVTTTGALRFFWSEDGSSLTSHLSTASVPFSNGEAGWIRATLDVDNGAGAYNVTFYTSADGESWTQLGDVVAGASTTSIHSGAVGVGVGAYPNPTAGAPLAGLVFAAEVYDGIDGTLVASYDATDAAATGEATTTSSRTGEVWTYQGDAKVYRDTTWTYQGDATPWIDTPWTLTDDAHIAAGPTEVQVNENEVHRRPVGDTSDGIRIATEILNSGSHDDYHLGSGEEVEYRIKAIGDNGTAAWSEWVA